MMHLFRIFYIISTGRNRASGANFDWTQRQSSSLHKRLGCLIKTGVQRSAFWLMTMLLMSGLVKFARNKVYWRLFCFHHLLELNPPKENSWPCILDSAVFYWGFPISRASTDGNITTKELNFPTIERLCNFSASSAGWKH